MNGVADAVALARSDVAAFACDRDVLRVSGPDAVSFLQGQVSADVAALVVGDSTWSLLLGPQGKVVSWLRVTRTGDDDLLMDVDAGWGETTEARLRRFLLRVEVRIEALTMHCVALRGPASVALAARVDAAGPRPTVDWRGLPGVDVFGPADGSAPRLPDDVTLQDPAALHVLRVEQGWPASGAELDDSTIPAEAGQWLIDASVSFTKGCYTGQELVARVDSRGGNTPRHLRGIRFDTGTSSEVPALGTPVLADGVERATVTSSAWSPTLGVPIALAMVHRSVAVGDRAEVAGAASIVVDLPFVSG